MIDIKLRCFDKILNYYLNEDDMPILGDGTDKICNFGSGDTFVFEQSIGKKLNGVDVFEGDILRAYIDKELPLFHIVEWSEKYLGWYLKNVKDVKNIGDGSVQAFVYFKNYEHIAEIVGNINENPELIK